METQQSFTNFVKTELGNFLSEQSKPYILNRERIIELFNATVFLDNNMESEGFDDFYIDIDPDTLTVSIGFSTNFMDFYKKAPSEMDMKGFAKLFSPASGITFSSSGKGEEAFFTVELLIPDLFEVIE